MPRAIPSWRRGPRSADAQLALDPQQQSVAGAEAARDQGMGQALRAERVLAWKAAAAAWLGEQPRGRVFTADDLVAAIGLPDSGVARNNVVGAWVAAQARRGRIVWTGEWRKSRRVIGHRNPQRVWKVMR